MLPHELKYSKGHSDINTAQFSRINEVFTTIKGRSHFFKAMVTLYKITKGIVSLTQPDFVYVKIIEAFLGTTGPSHFFKSCGRTLDFWNRKEAHNVDLYGCGHPKKGVIFLLC